MGGGVTAEESVFVLVYNGKRFPSTLFNICLEISDIYLKITNIIWKLSWMVDIF